MRKRLLLFFIMITNFLYAQEKQLKIRFIPVFNDEAIILNKNYYLESAKDSILFESLKFYISDIQFFKNKKKLSNNSPKYHLIDLDNSNSLVIFFTEDAPQKNFNCIKFNLGIDSLTNVSGAMGGDLDPTNGMYWTWQSGYINFKLEGQSKVCPARKNAFQFHIGGYSNPYNTLQKITLNVPSKKEIVIQIEIAALLDKINLKEIYQIMSPSAKAMEIAATLSTIFKIKK